MLPDELVDELDIVVEVVELSQAGATTALLDGGAQDAAPTLLDTTIETCGVSSG